MKKYFLYIVLFIICKTTNSQVYKAGTVYPYYYDVSPDSLLHFIAGTSHIESQSYYIDVDSDLQNDLRINSFGSGSAGTGYGYISIQSLNTNTFKRYKRYDTTCARKVALPLISNDSINSKISIWDSTELHISMSFHGPWGFGSINDWQQTNDQYIGIKYQSAIDTIYGWIRVNCDPNSTNSNYTYHCLVKDYSFQSIYAGVEELKIDQIKIYPNPTNDFINIIGLKQTKNSRLEIINPLGRTVLKTEFKNQIDVSELASGFYTLLLKDDSGGVITKKFVKE